MESGVLQQSPVALFILVLTVATSLIAWQYEDLFRLFALNPWSLVRERRYYTFLTSGLIHANVGHLFFNMFSFYWFAFPLERLMGHWQFLALYAASLVLSDITTVVKHGDTPDYFCVGASGAVTAVIFSFIIYEPNVLDFLRVHPDPDPRAALRRRIRRVQLLFFAIPTDPHQPRRAPLGRGLRTRPDADPRSGGLPSLLPDAALDFIVRRAACPK